ncbi:Lateral organ boundary [Sesbania bispinosa]|nr:Lateral organ boundary [Sesbania bispinosa]
MRMSCNGCRVLRKGCSENCSIRPCLQWIKSPESQANATVFLAKFYGRAGLMNLVNAGPEHLRPAIFRSLLYEACGRIVNPIYGSVAAANGRGPPLKAYDIRHVSKDENSAAASNETHQRVKTRSRVKRTVAGKPKVSANEEKTKNNKGTELGSAEPDSVRDAGVPPVRGGECGGRREQREREHGSVETAETSILFRDEPESNPKRSDRTDESGGYHVGLELTLGLEPLSRAHHVVPVEEEKD